MAKCKKNRPRFNVRKAGMSNSLGNRNSEKIMATKVVTASSIKMLAIKKDACVKTIFKRLFGVSMSYAIEPLSI